MLVSFLKAEVTQKEKKTITAIQTYIIARDNDDLGTRIIRDANSGIDKDEDGNKGGSDIGSVTATTTTSEIGGSQTQEKEATQSQNVDEESLDVMEENILRLTVDLQNEEKSQESVNRKLLSRKKMNLRQKL